MQVLMVKIVGKCNTREENERLKSEGMNDHVK